jgi:AcrR family transcriptional regulator
MGRATASGEPASNKREAVLAAAIRCFAAHGLAGTGMRDIARAAGLTEGTLYHYFASKDALIEDAFRWSAFGASELRETMQREALPLRERLLGVGAEFLGALRRDPHWTRVVIREALRAAPEGDGNPIRAPLISLATERIRALAAALRDEMAAGRIAACDPRRVAEHLLHALIGHFVAQAISGARPAAAADADPFLLHLVDTIARDLEGAKPRRALGARRHRGGRGR